MYRLIRLPRPGFALIAFGFLASGCAPHFEGSRFIRHVSYLASDDLEGRGLGTPGLERAAEYIAQQFQEAGLRPAGDDGTYFQKFDVIRGQEILGRPFLSVAGAPALGLLGRDFVPLPFSTPEAFEGPLAFAGYGISNDKEKYDDYDGFDAVGKVLLMLRYEPHAKDPKARFGGDTPSMHAAFQTKAMLARLKGAAGVLIVNPPMHHGERDALFAFESGGQVGRFSIPMMQVSQEYANRLLRAAGADDLATLQKALDQRQRRSMDLKGLVARGDPGLVRRKVVTRNVIAELPGGGPDAGEYIVIGAHYDHIGKVVPRKASGKGPAVPVIHNGADDNASGTSGVIELARTFAMQGGPDRSILFMAFSGEEEGLLGSEHYVDHPTVPLEKIVAMLNMDMIGRLRAERLDVFGTDTSAPLKRLVKYHGDLLGFNLKITGSGFGASDHSSFNRKHVPVLHFFTGVHGDYHMPSDDTETINAAGGARVVQFVYDVAESLGNAPARPTYVAVAEKEKEKERTPRTGLKVRLGVMPSYAKDEQAGLLIEGASAGSPAERAGLREGDRILMLGNHEVHDVYSLMDAMSRFNPGDEANVVVVRGGKRVQVDVKFEATRKE